MSPCSTDPRASAGWRATRRSARGREVSSFELSVSRRSGIPERLSFLQVAVSSYATDDQPDSRGGRTRMTAANESRNEFLVRQFFETLSTGDLEALRPLIHENGSWEATSQSIPGAGITKGRD